MTAVRTICVLAIASACFAARPKSPASQDVACLPAGMQPAAIVSADRVGDRLVTVTVAQRLQQLRAFCLRDSLVDSAGRPIRFYRLHCFGAPTQYAMETMRRERAELDSLRRRFTVVAMTCSPTGEPTP